MPKLLHQFWLHKCFKQRRIGHCDNSSDPFNDGKSKRWSFLSFQTWTYERNVSKSIFSLARAFDVTKMTIEKNAYFIRYGTLEVTAEDGSIAWRFFQGGFFKKGAALMYIPKDSIRDKSENQTSSSIEEKPKKLIFHSRWKE